MTLSFELEAFKENCLCEETKKAHSDFNPKQNLLRLEILWLDSSEGDKPLVGIINFLFLPSYRLLLMVSSNLILPVPLTVPRSQFLLPNFVLLPQTPYVVFLHPRHTEEVQLKLLWGLGECLLLAENTRKKQHNQEIIFFSSLAQRVSFNNLKYFSLSPVFYRFKKIEF